MKGLFFTYAMTGGGALISLFSPFYGLLCFVCFAIIKPEAMWPWAVPEGRYSLIIALCMLVGWSYSKRATFEFGRSGAVVGLLLAFLGWSTFGALFATHQAQAWAFVETFAKIAIPFLIGVTTIDSTAKLKQLAWTIVISQGYVAFELNMAYFRGYNTLATTGFGSLDNNSAAIALVTALRLTFFLGMQAKSLWAKGLALGLAALMGHAVLFSYSRGGMLAMLISGAAAFVVIPKRPKHYLAFALAAFMGVYLAGEEVRARFMTAFVKQDGQREASAQSRIDLWRDCLDVMDKQPIMGCGPNHWPLIAPNYGWKFGKEAHSLWMQTGAELGFIGLGLLLAFYGLVMFRLWKLTWKRTVVPDPFHRECARMVIAALTGFCVAAQFVSLEALEIPYYVALLGAGALKLHSLGAIDPAVGLESEQDVTAGTANVPATSLQPALGSVP